MVCVQAGAASATRASSVSHRVFTKTFIASPLPDRGLDRLAVVVDRVDGKTDAGGHEHESGHAGRPAEEGAILRGGRRRGLLRERPRRGRQGRQLGRRRGGKWPCRDGFRFASRGGRRGEGEAHQQSQSDHQGPDPWFRASHVLSSPGQNDAHLLKICADDAFVILNVSNRHAMHRLMPGMADVLIWKRIGRQVFWMLARAKRAYIPLDPIY